jgi:hypothetical protein
MNSFRTRFEETEDGKWAVIDVDHDVQVGWCRRTDGGWMIEDSLDGVVLGGPFAALDEAGAHADALLRHRLGIANPGW